MSGGSESQGPTPGSPEFTPVVPAAGDEVQHEETLEHALASTTDEDRQTDRMGDTPKSRFIARAVNRSYKAAHEGGLTREEAGEVMDLVALLAQRSFESGEDLLDPDNVESRAVLASRISSDDERERIIRQLKRALESDELTGVASLRSLNKALPHAEADDETAVVV
ncbi:MAG TPA: hypothetical protein VMR98_03205, partial [Candidatus Polarisedimenticolaceae bacterium]|nr:hypothetical protein [Candidatus Polarisedimenticolaceae bacterium]